MRRLFFYTTGILITALVILVNVNRVQEINIARAIQLANPDQVDEPTLQNREFGNREFFASRH